MYEEVMPNCPDAAYNRVQLIIGILRYVLRMHRRAQFPEVSSYFMIHNHSAESYILVILARI